MAEALPARPKTLRPAARPPLVSHMVMLCPARFSQCILVVGLPLLRTGDNDGLELGEVDAVLWRARQAAHQPLGVAAELAGEGLETGRPSWRRPWSPRGARSRSHRPGPVQRCPRAALRVRLRPRQGAPVG